MFGNFVFGVVSSTSFAPSHSFPWLRCLNSKFGALNYWSFALAGFVHGSISNFIFLTDDLSDWLFASLKPTGFHNANWASADTGFPSMTPSEEFLQADS